MNLLKPIHLSLLSLTLVSPSVFSAIEIGKVLSITGKVVRVPDDKKTERLTLIEKSPVYENDTILTAAKSAVKITLSDGSEISLGPVSRAKVEPRTEKKPAALNNILGSIRAKVQKSVDGNKTKMIIKTKSATMGVRGTDFQVLYNAQTQASSLVTYEGRVDMTKSDPAQNQSIEQAYAQLQDPKQVVQVPQGEFSGISPSQAEPSIPVKVSPAQLESLKSSDVVRQAQNEKPPEQARVGSGAEKKLMSPVPPGIDAKQVSMTTGKLQEKITEQTTASRSNGGAEKSAPPPEGAYNAATGQFAPPPGGFIDLKTGVYLPPPPGSAYDPVSKVYVPPPQMGGFSAATGEYVPPAGYVLDASKGFMTVEAAAKSAASSPGANPATPGASGITGTGAAGPFFSGGMKIQDFGGTMMAAPLPPGENPGNYTRSDMIMPSAQTYITSSFKPGENILNFTGTQPINYDRPPAPQYDASCPAGLCNPQGPMENSYPTAVSTPAPGTQTTVKITIQ